MPTKWLQERPNGSKNDPVIGFEGLAWTGGERPAGATLETTQGQIDGFMSQLRFKCYLLEEASAED